MLEDLYKQLGIVEFNLIVHSQSLQSLEGEKQKLLNEIDKLNREKGSGSDS